ncbi:unnamed protein product [Brassica oleracea var. botrytis]
MKRFQSIYKTLSKVFEKRLRGKIQRIDYIEEGLSAFDIWLQRKGKPLILISSSSEKSKLASVSKVVPGKKLQEDILHFLMKVCSFWILF